MAPWKPFLQTSEKSFWGGHLRDTLGVSIRSGPGKPNQRKVSSWTFRRGIPEQKFNVNRACFPKEKHQNSQQRAKFMNFSFWPFLWFGLLGRLVTLTKRDVLENVAKRPRWGGSETVTVGMGILLLRFWPRTPSWPPPPSSPPPRHPLARPALAVLRPSLKFSD